MCAEYNRDILIMIFEYIYIYIYMEELSSVQNKNKIENH